MTTPNRFSQTGNIVRHIFRLCAEGRGPSQIAKQLKAEQILTPTNYYYRQTGVALVDLDTERPYNWSSRTVANILEDVSYLGHTVNMRYTTVSYKKRGREECTAHYIWETQLKTIVLDDLKRVTHYARQKEKLFAEHITRKNTAETRQEITRIQREIDAARRRDGELTALFKRLYEDNVLGRIPNEHFRLLSAEYTTEQAELRNRLPKMEERMELLRNSLTNVAQFIDKAKRYSNITELTPEILRLFIEKIVVGEKSQKYSRTAEQDI